MTTLEDVEGGGGAVSTPEHEKLAGSADAAKIDASLAGAYSFLQLVVGGLAVALPFMVLAIDWLFNDREWFTTRGSISAYYYAPGGGWLVGTLCVTAFFFLSYKYEWDRRDITDFVTTKVASVAALGVALFPTPSEGSGANVIGWIHYVSAFLLFGILTFLVLFSFTKSAGYVDQDLRAEIRRCFREPSGSKLLKGKARRNGYYRVTGWTMAIVLLFSLVYSRIEAAWSSSPLLFLPDSWFFFAESVVVILFGFIWLLKSQRVPVLPTDQTSASSGAEAAV